MLKRLSILSMRFQKIVNAGVTEAITFNSLYEIRDAAAKRIFDWAENFQFSL